MITLKFGALEIPLLAALEIEQSYDEIGGETVFRTTQGVGIKQTTWAKHQVTTSGGGWIPPGLDALDRSAPMQLACVTPCSVAADFSTRQATLPATRRSDAGHVPWGLAFLPDGGTVKTAAALVGNVATLAAVSGAVAYVAMYLPQYSVWAGRPTVSGSRSDASYRWDIVCEEV